MSREITTPMGGEPRLEQGLAYRRGDQEPDGRCDLFGSNEADPEQDDHRELQAPGEGHQSRSGGDGDGDRGQGSGRFHR